MDFHYNFRTSPINPCIKFLILLVLKNKNDPQLNLENVQLSRKQHLVFAYGRLLLRKTAFQLNELLLQLIVVKELLIKTM